MIGKKIRFQTFYRRFKVRLQTVVDIRKNKRIYNGEIHIPWEDFFTGNVKKEYLENKMENQYGFR